MRCRKRSGSSNDRDDGRQKNADGPAPWDAPQELRPRITMQIVTTRILPQPCAHTVEVAKDFKTESGIHEQELERLTHAIVAALKTVYDPGDSR